MKRYLTILLAAAGACGLQAQSTEVKQGYNGIKVDSNLPSSTPRAAGNLTIRNNWIHANCGNGILAKAC